MGLYWYNLLSQLLGWGYSFFRDLYHEAQQPILKLMNFGEMTVFTPGQFLINLLLFFFLMRYITHKDWWKGIIYLWSGKVLGTFFVAILISTLSDQYETIILDWLAKMTSVLIILIGTLFVLRSRQQVKQLNVRTGLGFGFITTLILDQTIYINFRMEPLFYQSNTLFLSLFTVTSISLFLMLALVFYGFEVDKKIKRNMLIFYYVINILFFIIGLNLFVIAYL